MKGKSGFYIGQIAALQKKVFDDMLRAHGLEFSSAQGRILYILWQNGPGLMSDISRQTGLANNTITAAVARMEAAGLLRRTARPEDRREVMVTLTPKAEAAKGEYEQVSEEMCDFFYKGFTQEEIDTLDNYLARLLGTLQGVGEGNG